jgi:hypothetical protein
VFAHSLQKSCCYHTKQFLKYMLTDLQNKKQGKDVGFPQIVTVWLIYHELIITSP